MLKFEVLTAYFSRSLQCYPFQPINRASLAGLAARLCRSLPYQGSPTLVSRFYLEWTTYLTIGQWTTYLTIRQWTTYLTIRQWTTYLTIGQWTTTFFREHPEYQALLRPQTELPLTPMIKSSRLRQVGYVTQVG